jgi:hypothetical protein
MPMLTKLDLKKELKHLYQPTAEDFTLIDVPPMHFLMIDGAGDPNTSQEYQDAVQALYSVSYTLKFAIKKARQIDYPVMALEGLWWTADMRTFSAERKGDWLWTMMMMQPAPVMAEDVAAALEEIRRKKGLAAVERVRFERFHEGLAVQIMHIGSYADEAPTLRRLHDEYLPSHGYVATGKHHEIYLSDPRRSPPEKWKTVLRQPVRKVGG